MLSNRWRLLVLAVLLLPVGLTGCRRAVTVAQEENRALASESSSPGAVVRAKVSAEDQKGPEKGEKPQAAEGFQFPDDKGGALLAKVLPPSVDQGALLDRTTQPRRRTGPGRLDLPALPLPATAAPLPRVLLQVKRPPLQPRLIFEETLGDRGEPRLPQIPAFKTGERVRLPSVDVTQPPPLPLLATQPTLDRASLEDATADASTAAALSAVPPERTRPVPFQKLTIPDPYENRQPARLADPLPENPNPPVGSPRTPKP